MSTRFISHSLERSWICDSLSFRNIGSVIIFSGDICAQRVCFLSIYWSGAPERFNAARKKTASVTQLKDCSGNTCRYLLSAGSHFCCAERWVAVSCICGFYQAFRIRIGYVYLRMGYVSWKCSSGVCSGFFQTAEKNSKSPIWDLFWGWHYHRWNVQLYGSKNTTLWFNSMFWGRNILLWGWNLLKASLRSF